jgi:endonuclease/exonuclease/phosphatase family metal-dependent hydrolase
MRVLTWNLFHGRSQPPAGRDLLAEFGDALARWEWDVAMLQEVPPWWPRLLADRLGAGAVVALTSRNLGLRLRRMVAVRRPDLIKSNGGGCNAILSRREAVVEHRALRLRTWPERRVAQLARLAGGACVANYHGSARIELARAELGELWERALVFSAGAPLVLGGDLNLRKPQAPLGCTHVASRDVDHLFARALVPVGTALRLDRHVAIGARRVELSDHVPLLVELQPARPAPGAS